MSKKLVMTGIAAAVILGGATMAGAAMNSQSDAVTVDEKPIERTQPSSSEQVQTEDAFISLDEAATIALAEYDGYIDSIELEKENGDVYYEVEIENQDVEYELDIDAVSGDILKVEEDDNDDDGLVTKKDADNLL